MDILETISKTRKENLDFSGNPEEAVFIFEGALGETLAKQRNIAGNAAKILAAFSSKPVQSNFYEVFEQEKMSNLIPRLSVKTAFLCVPHKQARYMSEQLINSGIERIVNWSGETLSSSASAVILNEEPPCVYNSQN